MNVKELKKLLADLPDEMEILIQKDNDGYYPYSFGNFELNPVCLPFERSGSVYSVNLAPEDQGILKEDEWKNILKRPRAIVLRPKY